MNLKPISSYERGLLSLLDETPAGHQDRLMKRAKGEKVDQVLQELKEGTTKIGPTIAESAAALELRLPKWREDAYCIFIAHTTCKSCGMHQICQRDPFVYLRERMVKRPGISDADLLASNPYKYTPVKSISNWLLPKIKITTIHRLLACEFCFEDLTCLPKEPFSLPSLDDIESPEAPPAGSGELSESPLEPPPPASSLKADSETSSKFPAPLLQAGNLMNLETSPSPQFESIQPIHAGVLDFGFHTEETDFAIQTMQMGEG